MNSSMVNSELLQQAQISLIARFLCVCLGFELSIVKIAETITINYVAKIAKGLLCSQKKIADYFAVINFVIHLALDFSVFFPDSNQTPCK